MKRILYQAHRGVSTDCPENTMSAYRAAVEQNYDIIELDPKFTGDGVCVLLHDHTVNRTGRRLDERPVPESCGVETLTYDELREMEFGSWFAPEYRGEPIPTLDEVLAFSKDNGIPLKIDNVIESFTPNQQETVFEAIRRAGLGENVGITCTSLEFVRRVTEVLPDAAVHFDGLVTEDTLKAVSALLRNNALYVWLRYDNQATAWCKNPPADPETAAMVKRYGRLGVWKLSKQAEMEDAVQRLHADVLETNGELKPGQ